MTFAEARFPGQEEEQCFLWPIRGYRVDRGFFEKAGIYILQELTKGQKEDWRAVGRAVRKRRAQRHADLILARRERRQALERAETARRQEAWLKWKDGQRERRLEAARWRVRAEQEELERQLHAVARLEQESRFPRPWDSLAMRGDLTVLDREKLNTTKE